MATLLQQVAGLVLGLGLTGPASAETAGYRGYEMPAYTVERQIGALELRAYDSHLLASVTVQGDRNQALGKGFRLLAGYIFGKNSGSEKVAMTVPVTQTPDLPAAAASGTGDRWSVTFAMPTGWTAQTLPQPENPGIRFDQIPPERLVVLAFSGMATAARVDAKGAELRRLAQAAGLSVTGPVRALFYDDPFTLPWRRRNEVALRVD